VLLPAATVMLPHRRRLHGPIRGEFSAPRGQPARPRLVQAQAAGRSVVALTAAIVQGENFRP